MSDAHTYLFEERDRLLKLQSENDELRLQEVEDRKRIRHLLAMHGPLEQEITYNRDGKPNTVTVYPRNGQENVPKRANQAEASERVMRTVYLPAANADNLMLKVESLQAQLNEQVCQLLPSGHHSAKTCLCSPAIPAKFLPCFCMIGIVDIIIQQLLILCNLIEHLRVVCSVVQVVRNRTHCKHVLPCISES